VGCSDNRVRSGGRRSQTLGNVASGTNTGIVEEQLDYFLCFSAPIIYSLEVFSSRYIFNFLVT
jgi:hypothetical protein